MSLRDEILAADDRPRRKLSIPEWGRDVWIRVMSAAQREQWERDTDDVEGIRKRHLLRAALAVRTVCDEDGSPVFTTADMEALAEKSGPALCRIWDAAIAANKVSKADVEELAKNSDASPSDGSASSSPAT